MKKITVSSQALLFLDELVTTLVQNEYFGFLDTSLEYVNQIYDFIENDLTNVIHYPTPKELLKYGKYYAKLKVNNRTTWYVFFDKMDNRYFIEFITNNHTPQGAFLNLD